MTWIAPPEAAAAFAVKPESLIVTDVCMLTCIAPPESLATLPVKPEFWMTPTDDEDSATAAPETATLRVNSHATTSTVDL